MNANKTHITQHYDTPKRDNLQTILVALPNLFQKFHFPTKLKISKNPYYDDTATVECTIQTEAHDQSGN